MIEVIRVKLDLPAHMCILSKFGVETVIVALDSADCRAQSRPLDSIAETRCRSKSEQVLLIGKRQPAFFGQICEQAHILRTFLSTLFLDKTCELLAALLLGRETMAVLVQKLAIRLQVLVRCDTEPRPV